MIIAEKIFRDLGEACSCDVLGSSPDLQRIEAFLWSFSARNPLPFPRAAMQTMLLMFVEPVSEGFEPIESVLWHELQGLLPSQNFLSPKILELEAPNDEGFKACQAVRHWFAECGHVALTYLKSLCQNRCRIRRRLAHVLRDVDNVHMAVGNTAVQERCNRLTILQTVQVFGDTAPQSARSLSRFAQSRILLVTAFLELRIMTGIIELGFELDLHSQQELARLSTYQTSLYSLMSSMRTRVVKEDRNHSWVQLARQTAARCPSLDPGRDHLLARTLRGVSIVTHANASPDTCGRPTLMLFTRVCRPWRR